MDFTTAAALAAYLVGALVGLAGQGIVDHQIAKRYTIPRLREKVNADADAKLKAQAEDLDKKLGEWSQASAAAVVAEVRALLSAAPSPADRDEARAELARAVAEAAQAVVPQAVEAAVGEAVKGRMGALSAAAGDARTTKAAQEQVLKARVGERYGIKGLGALALLRATDKDAYQFGLDAATYAVDDLDKWLDEKAGLFGAGDSKTRRITVV